MENHEALDALGIAWRLGATFFFVFLNGFFVAAEFALVKVRGSRIDLLVGEGRRGAKRVRHIYRHLDHYLSACQLGITMASLILGALGEPAVSVLLLAVFGAVGVEVSADASWLPILSIALAFSVITMLHMTIGEQAPKMWAIRRPERMAIATAPILRVFAWIFAPMIGAINSISNGLLKLLGLPSGSHGEESHDASEIRNILSLSAGAGHISEREYELTENVFRMMQLEVRHILVPRTQVTLLSLEHSIADNLELIKRSEYSRFPVCEVGLDSIVGIVHTKDLLAHSLEGKLIDLRELAREAFFVPDTMALTNFLSELREHQAECAAVADERGTVVGFAFLEDALEEVVGPLGEDFDAPEQVLREVEPGVFEAPADLPLPELCDRLDFSLEPEENEDEDTLGGHVIARLGRWARPGDVVQIGPYSVEVVETSLRRIDRLRLVRKNKSADAVKAGQ